MIGGNTKVTIQVKKPARNEIGEAVAAWSDVQTLYGWLDLMSGEAKYTSFNTKLQETTHVFIGDYQELDPQIKSENSRMVANGEIYDITLIDNPMGLNSQIEIYLTYTGGQ